MLILRVLQACTAELKLEPELRRRLEKLLEVVADSPWRVRDLLEELRRSSVVPVPGLLVKLDREAVQNRQWRYDDPGVRPRHGRATTRRAGAPAQPGPGSKSTEVESIFSPATS